MDVDDAFVVSISSDFTFIVDVLQENNFFHFIFHLHRLTLRLDIGLCLDVVKYNERAFYSAVAMQHSDYRLA